MSRRNLKADDEEGFLKAVSDDVHETESLYRVKVKIEFKALSARGKFRIIATAWKGVGTLEERCVAEWNGEYPTLQAMRVHAALYRAVVGLGAACGRAGLPYRHEDSDGTVV
jgi:hypothetical protein